MYRKYAMSMSDDTRVPTWLQEGVIALEGR